MGSIYLLRAPGPVVHWLVILGVTKLNTSEIGNCLLTICTVFKALLRSIQFYSASSCSSGNPIWWVTPAVREWLDSPKAEATTTTTATATLSPFASNSSSPWCHSRAPPAFGPGTSRKTWPAHGDSDEVTPQLEPKWRWRSKRSPTGPY